METLNFDSSLSGEVSEEEAVVFEFIKKKYGSKQRTDGISKIKHLMTVRNTVYLYDKEPDILIAALLHDFYKDFGLEELKVKISPATQKILQELVFGKGNNLIAERQFRVNILPKLIGMSSQSVLIYLAHMHNEILSHLYKRKKSQIVIDETKSTFDVLSTRCKITDIVERVKKLVSML